VWKKLGIKSASIEDTQDDAQEELQKEGAGVRKKLRVLTARENINDAMWAEAISDPSVKNLGMIIDSCGKQHLNVMPSIRLVNSLKD
jgi:hypothetical protein